MRTKLLRILFMLFVSNAILGQKAESLEIEKKSNPIIYFEGFGGPSVVQNIGVAGGLELNYQIEKSLFSLRFANAAGYTKLADYLILIPHYYKSEDYKEYSFLYGRRWLSTNHSYSISGGISYNDLELASRDSEGKRIAHYENFYGVSFEANYKWFYKKRKSRLVYNAMIPSVGVKLFGNIGEYAYAGVGVTVGFGLSKKY